MIERWNERYRNGEGVGRSPDRFVVEAASALAPTSALDVACGAGRHALWLAGRGWQVTAADASSAALELVGRFDNNGRIQTLLVDLEAEGVEVPGEFGLVVQALFLWRPLWPAILAAVAPGGHYIGVFPAEGMKRPEYMIEPDELQAVFSGWTVLRSEKAAGLTRFFAQRPLLS